MSDPLRSRRRELIPDPTEGPRGRKVQAEKPHLAVHGDRARKQRGASAAACAAPSPPRKKPRCEISRSPDPTRSPRCPTSIASPRATRKPRGRPKSRTADSRTATISPSCVCPPTPPVRTPRSSACSPSRFPSTSSAIRSRLPDPSATDSFRFRAHPPAANARRSDDPDKTEPTPLGDESGQTRFPPLRRHGRARSHRHRQTFRDAPEPRRRATRPTLRRHYRSTGRNTRPATPSFTVRPKASPRPADPDGPRVHGNRCGIRRHPDARFREKHRPRSNNPTSPRPNHASVSRPAVTSAARHPPRPTRHRLTAPAPTETAAVPTPASHRIYRSANPSKKTHLPTTVAPPSVAQTSKRRPRRTPLLIPA